jgi:hypothetical protein
MAANVTAEAITDEVHKDVPTATKTSIVGRKSTIHEHPFMKEVRLEDLRMALIIIDVVCFSSSLVV